VLYLVFAVLHAKSTPTGLTGLQNAPDEQAHVEYIQTLLKGTLPTQARAEASPTGYEWHQPPLYYLLSALFYAVGGVFGGRLFSVLCGVVCILLVFAAGRRLFPQEPLIGTVAAGTVAFLPTHIAVSSTMNNDTLLEVCFGGVLLLLMVTVLDGLEFRRTLAIGAILGLACLTKVSALLLIPVIAFGLFLARGESANGKTIVRAFATILGVAFVACGWWYIRNGLLYGEFIPLKAFSRAFAGTAQARDFVAQVGWGGYISWVGQWSFQSFWAVFGTVKSAEKGMPLFLPEAIYLVPALWVFAVLVGMTRLHFQRNKLFTPQQIGALRTLFVTFGLVLASFCGFLLQYFQTQGRYLYPALMPIAMVGALGWLALFPPRMKAYAGYGFVGFLLLIAVLLLFFAMP
jgi:4-amino-4-deoxy-L-arabinose transferase-like glycosyltransferase